MDDETARRLAEAIEREERVKRALIVVDLVVFTATKIREVLVMIDEAAREGRPVEHDPRGSAVRRMPALPPARK